jgi:hypothetical protein
VVIVHNSVGAGLGEIRQTVVTMNGRNRVTLDGEWDLSRRDELIGLCSTLAKDGPATIDLRDCRYADSTVERLSRAKAEVRRGSHHAASPAPEYIAPIAR